MLREKFAWQGVPIHEGIDEVRAVRRDPRAEDEKHRFAQGYITQ